MATGASLSIGSTSAIGDVLTCQATASDGTGAPHCLITLSGGGVYTGLVLNGTTNTLTSGTYLSRCGLTNGATLYIDGDVTPLWIP